MMRRVWTIWALAAVGALAGCNQTPPGRTRSLGDVSYASAFATSKDVMSQYFAIEKADAQEGVIRSRPKRVEAGADRILGGSPARQIATLTLTHKEGQVVAHMSIPVQRQGSSIYRRIGPASETYHGAPTETPAESEGATTPEQNEAWRTEKYDHELANTILGDIYRALHPNGTAGPPAAPPTTAPAGR